jgi:hypothetical protein
MALALRDNAYHTYADYLAWPENVRYELIDGMAYRLLDGRYGEPVMQELAGTTPVSVLPGVVIAWDHLVSRLPKLDL